MIRKTAHITSNGYDLGQGGYTNFHRIQLPGLGTTPPLEDEKVDPAVNFRKGILFYFGNCELPNVGFKDVKGLFELPRKGKKVVDAIRDAQKEDWGRNAEVKTVADSVSSALNSAKANSPAWLTSVAKEASTRIQEHMPDVISGMLSEIGKLNVPVVGNMVKSGKALVGAIQKTVTYWNTRNLDAALRSGSPQVIVGALRKQIGQDAATKFATAIYEAAKGVAAVVAPAAGPLVTKVIDTIKTFLTYIWKLFMKIRDYLALEKFFTACKKMFTSNAIEIHSQTAYVDWISNWIGELPIIASHCISSTMTGSYFGFLSTLVDPALMPKAYSAFVSLKKPATSYVKNYPFEFSSSNVMVKQSLTIIQKGGVDLTDGAAAQSVGWFRRKYMKYGSKLGVVKNRLY